MCGVMRIKPFALRAYENYAVINVKLMKIQQVIETINQMRTDGIIDHYAIGGAVGATFYLEPVATFDVDVFVSFQPLPGQLIISPQPLFDYLKAREHRIEGEYIVIADWPVQFLPPANSLVEEALAQANEMDVDGTPTFVFSAEHLAAIALQTGRAKDKARLLQFVETGSLDKERFQAIVMRHQLIEAWKKFEQMFLEEEL